MNKKKHKRQTPPKKEILDLRPNHIYNASNKVLGIGDHKTDAGRRLLQGDHDIVFLRYATNDKKFSLVRAVTSLAVLFFKSEDKWDYRVKDKNLRRAIRGEITPVPLDVLGSENWSGIHSKIHEIKTSHIRKRRHCRREKIPRRYLKLGGKPKKKK